jgi:cell division protein YceG involved in septum cleavage
MSQAAPDAEPNFLQNSMPAVLFLLLTPLLVWWYLSRPTRLPTPLEVNIPSGMTAHEIGLLLKEKGLVRNATVFAWTARLHGQS